MMRAEIDRDGVDRLETDEPGSRVGDVVVQRIVSGPHARGTDRAPGANRVVDDDGSRGHAVRRRNSRAVRRNSRAGKFTNP
eukprot:6017695-Prymnesium_polylepis.1